MDKVTIELYVREHPELGRIGLRVGEIAMGAARAANPELVTGFIEVQPLNIPDDHRKTVEGLFPNDPYRVDL